jgi:hypothetical protein
MPGDHRQAWRLAPDQQRGLQTFVEVGQALLEIRDSRLYRQAAEVVGTLGPIGPTPDNERAARELTGLKPE